MSRLLVLSGPPAAGKSATARLLAAGPGPTVLLGADAFFEHIVVGAVPPWQPGSEAQNETWMRAAFAAAATYRAGGYDVVLDALLGPWFLPTLTDLVPPEVVDYVLLVPPLAETLRRLGGRAGHGLTDVAAVTHMHAEIVAALPGWEAHAFDPSGLTPAQVAAAIRARQATGRLALPPGEDPPRT